MDTNIRIFINIKSASGEIDHLLESPMRWARAEVVRRRGGQGRAELGRDEGLALGWRWFGGIAETVTSCNSSGTRIGLPGPSRAHQLARWHRFVSIEHREPLQTSLQGTFARAMICWKNPDLPHTALRASWCPVPRFPAIHLARQSPFYGTAGHIRSRDGIDLCPSRTANPSRQRSRAHSLAR